MARTQVVADSFPVDGDLTGAGKNWTRSSWATAIEWKVVSGRTAENLDEHRTVIYTGPEAFANDQYATANLYGIDAAQPTRRAGVMVRASGSQETFVSYNAYIYQGSDYVKKLQLSKNPGVNLVTKTVTFNSGDTLTLEAEGGATTTLRVYRNGTELLHETTDSSSPILTGRPGLVSRGLLDAGVGIDNFAAGNLGTASASITLSPDPASVTTGGTTQITITRSAAAPAGAGSTYNLTFGTPGVASASATANMAEGLTTATFNITGVSPGTTTLTVTNAADSAETDTLTVNVIAQRKLKLLAHIDALGATAVKGAVFAAPTGGALTGAKIGEFTGAAFGATSESGQAPLLVDVEDFGGEALTSASSPVCVWEGTSAAASALGNAVPIASAGPHECTVIEV